MQRSNHHIYKASSCVLIQCIVHLHMSCASRTYLIREVAIALPLRQQSAIKFTVCSADALLGLQISVEAACWKHPCATLLICHAIIACRHVQYDCTSQNSSYSSTKEKKKNHTIRMWQNAVTNTENWYVLQLACARDVTLTFCQCPFSFCHLTCMHLVDQIRALLALELML